MGDIWGHKWPEYFDKWLVPYVLVDGWGFRSRSSGGFDSVMAVQCHHTVDSTSIENVLHWELVQSEDEPIGNMTIARDGVWHITTAGASNTSGKGGPLLTKRGVIPLDNGNRNIVAIEAQNNGIGETWPDAMQHSYPLGVAALCDWAQHETPGGDFFGAFSVHAHFEWAPTRKNDPAGPSQWDGPPGSGAQRWDMDKFRGDVFNLLMTPEEDVLHMDDEVRAAFAAINERLDNQRKLILTTLTEKDFDEWKTKEYNRDRLDLYLIRDFRLAAEAAAKTFVADLAAPPPTTPA